MALETATPDLIPSLRRLSDAAVFGPVGGDGSAMKRLEKPSMGNPYIRFGSRGREMVLSREPRQALLRRYRWSEKYPKPDTSAMLLVSVLL